MKPSQILLMLVILIVAYYFYKLLKDMRPVYNLAYIDQRQYINSLQSQSSEEKSWVDETSNFRKSVDALIRSARIDEALLRISDYTEKNASFYHSEVLHLSSRWEIFKKDTRLGILGESESKTHRNQLVSSLLGLVETVCK